MARSKKLTEENYFSNDMAKKYMSVSQLKEFIGTPFKKKCDKRTLAKLNGEYEEDKSDALVIGSYVDVCLTGSPEEVEKFKENHPEMFSSRGATKGQLKSQYLLADKMVEKVKNDKLMMKTLEGAKQVILTGKIYGVDFKCKIDCLNLEKGFITDLKTCKSIIDSYYDADANRRMSFVEYQDYITQGAIYQELVRQNYKKELPFFLTCVSKEKEPDIAVIQIDNDTLKERLEELKPLIEEAQLVKTGKVEPIECGCCDYCKAHKVLESPINWLQIGE